MVRPTFLACEHVDGLMVVFVFRIALGCGYDRGRGWQPPAECARARDRQATGHRVLGDRLQVQVLKRPFRGGFELIVYHTYYTCVKLAT